MPAGTIHTQKKNPSLRKIILWICLLITIVVAAVYTYWWTNKKEIIRAKIEKAFTKEGEGLYKVDYSDMTIDETAGYLSITGMTVTYDPGKYATAVKESKAPPRSEERRVGKE